ncbi:carboxypeptidase-like regulatory domain-containing protein, partial [bacterium]|nr:carboxypeptidase-like regulatory domain-containing protein [bacterium]
MLKPILLSILLVSPVFAQENQNLANENEKTQKNTSLKKGNIKGKILDQTTKQPLLGASVLIVGMQKGASTDENGNFLVPELDENLYKLQISYIGYNSTFKNDVRVVRGK